MRIAIVGAGFSGLLLAIHLLRRDKATSIILIERANQFGRGLAYGTGDPRHLLNVRAGNMSAFPEDPDHFVKWLALNASDHSRPLAFAPRYLYGTYLQTLLRTALATEAGAGRLIVMPDEAVALVERPEGLGLRMAIGRVLDVDHVVLATGNLPPHDPPGLEPALIATDHYVADPWRADAFATIAPSDRVLLVGTGLTAVDVMLGLDRRGHHGPLLAISRRGLRPRAHAERGPTPARYDVPSRPPLSQLVRSVRREANRHGDWRAAADGLRPHIQRLWREASPAERGRFLRHARPWWDVHRHRLAPPVDAMLRSLEETGRVSIVAAKIIRASLDAGGVTVAMRRRGYREAACLPFDRVVNCTGPVGDVRKARSPLLFDLLKRGVARPDSQGLGIEVDADCRVVAADGHPSPLISAIGPMSRGAFWEVTAVPDIRVQAGVVASRLA